MRIQKKSPYEYIFLFCLVTLFLSCGDSGMCQTWNAGNTALLPDSSFALVEIKKIERIGTATFNAIKFYITVK